MNLGAHGSIALGGLAALLVVAVLALTGHCDAGVAAHFGIR